MNKDHEVLHVDQDGKIARVERDGVSVGGHVKGEKLQDAIFGEVRGRPQLRTGTDLGDDKRPGKTSGWTRKKMHERRSRLEATSFTYWMRHGLCAISALELADAPDGRGDQIPQWHLSLSAENGSMRPTDLECQQTLACFGLVGAEEDNHHPGVARHFWMPLDPKRRVECECKTTERVIVEPDGYKYSEKIGMCAGCELEVTSGKACVVDVAVADVRRYLTKRAA